MELVAIHFKKQPTSDSWAHSDIPGKMFFKNGTCILVTFTASLAYHATETFPGIEIKYNF